MCILFIALETHPDYPLIVCANRDEFHIRPTEPAHFWPPENQLLAGRDLQAGGSWLGINRQGYIAAVTNIRAPELQQSDKRSRGELVINSLQNPEAMNATWLEEQGHFYNPFNLLFGQGHRLYCFHSVDNSIKRLSPGFHAISNGALDDIWPKMAKGTQALEQQLSHNSPPDIDALLQIMTDQTQADDTLLPQTGIALEWERQLSSIYIKHPEYGTRSTSIIIQDKLGNCRFIEVRYDGKGRNLGQQTFNIPAD
ncbi:NRDE family protein [Shewanella sp. Isolate11]|uniref:NRDE family protein n=1 Tax=Shewanella sp. Isolate11 TaxID=2908530 RepID=UPI001EFDC61B|nr:NRDE family protein [Shewanella sp. Isolate11]MCG9698394.1 NRDE family protein [Shewanella sp. Isolate11]